MMVRGTLPRLFSERLLSFCKKSSIILWTIERIPKRKLAYLGYADSIRNSVHIWETRVVAGARSPVRHPERLTTSIFELVISNDDEEEEGGTRGHYTNQ